MNPDNPEDNVSPGWEGILLAFDFGLKRTGVAIGNTLLKKAEPLMVIHEESNAGRFRAIESLVVKWHPVGLVVGLPLHADGTAHGMTKRCRRFANQLHGRFGLGTVLVDERFSSCVLNFKRGEEDDAHAAALILQQYFDERSS